MAPMSFTGNDATALNANERETLLSIARAAIGEGLNGSRYSIEDLSAHTAILRAHAATFVTLDLHGELRGCIGTLEAFQPLVVDTAENAYAAAYRDPRFPALAPHEFERLDIHISILGPPEPMVFGSEQQLLEQLRPGVDGLILSERGRRGTFLPAVWETVPDPREFLKHLKAKAGLPADYWSDSIKVSRYTTVSIS